MSWKQIEREICLWEVCGGGGALRTHTWAMGEQQEMISWELGATKVSGNSMRCSGAGRGPWRCPELGQAALALVPQGGGVALGIGSGQFQDDLL